MTTIEHEKIINKLPLKIRKDLIKSFKESLLIREINKLLICNSAQYTFFLVLNEETSHFKYFYTEEEAVNYCLDNYKKSKQYKQAELLA